MSRPLRQRTCKYSQPDWVDCVVKTSTETIDAPRKTFASFDFDGLAAFKKAFDAEPKTSKHEEMQKKLKKARNDSLTASSLNNVEKHFY